jgi:hypothetical protein
MVSMDQGAKDGRGGINEDKVKAETLLINS